MSRERLEGELRATLRRVGATPQEEACILELMAEVCLTYAAADPAYPVLTDEQLRRRQRRESTLCDELAADPNILHTRVETAAEVQYVMAEAGLTRDEQTVLIVSAECGDRTAICRLGLSESTYYRRKREAQRKLQAFRCDHRDAA